MWSLAVPIFYVLFALVLIYAFYSLVNEGEKAPKEIEKKMEDGDCDLHDFARVAGEIGVCCWEIEPIDNKFKKLFPENFLIYGCDWNGVPLSYFDNPYSVDEFRLEDGRKCFTTYSVRLMLKDYYREKDEKEKERNFLERVRKKQEAEISSILNRKPFKTDFHTSNSYKISDE